MAKGQSNTPKGSAPLPMRRSTKRKRPWYGVNLCWRRLQKDMRREARALGDSNVRE